jgi:Ca2+-binding EF-hand superfamily protein
VNPYERRGKPFTEAEFAAFLRHFHAIDERRTGYISREGMAAFAGRSGVKLSDDDLTSLIDDKVGGGGAGGEVAG